MTTLIGTIENTVQEPCTDAPSDIDSTQTDTSSLAEPMRLVRNAILTDEGYAIGWYANLVMAGIDSGVNRAAAERSAERFMNILFDTNISELYPNFSNTKVPAKPALGFKRSDLEEVFSKSPKNGMAYGLLPHSFWGLTTELFDRAVCETDSSLKQIIPYVALTNTPKDTGVQEVFYYERGKGSAEERLKSKISIGLGGHVDATGGNLYNLLQTEAQREIIEEVGLHLEKERFQFETYLIDNCPDGNEVSVGSVHFGLFTCIEITDEERASIDTEREVITKGGWETTENLVENFMPRLEPWSVMSLYILSNFSNSEHSTDSPLQMHFIPAEKDNDSGKVTAD